jgi:hypothetical protein
MAAKYILATLACAFLIAGTRGMARPEKRIQSRTWLLVGAIFGLISFWLFARR